MRIGLNAHLLSFESSYRQAGVSRYIAALLRELPALLDEDELVAFSGPLTDEQRARYDAGIAWRATRLPTANPVARILWEQSAGQLAGPRERLAVFHSPVNVAPVGSPTPLVTTVHDLAFERFPEQYPAAKQRYLRLMTRLSTRRAAKVIAVSRATGRDLVELYGVPQPKIEVIPNGIDEGFGRPPEAELAQFRAARQLPEDFFLFVGTLQPRKNLDTLLRAYALVAGQVSWPLVVVGAAGWQYDPIFQLVRRLGIGERVRFAGYAPGDELACWYGSAAVFVLPARYEGFGLPVLEAMACGTPVITSNRSSLPEVAGEAALLVDPDRPQELAAALLKLAAQPELRQELAQRGLRQAAGFSWRRSAAATMQVYRQVGRGR